MNPVQAIITKHTLLEPHDLAALWKAAHELAESEGITYPAARMRIKRQLERTAINLANGKDPFEKPAKGGAMPNAGRPQKGNTK